MKQNVNEFDDVIEMIKAAANEELFTDIAISEIGERLFYGKMVHGFIQEPIELPVSGPLNVCQGFYEALQSAFGEELTVYYFQNMDNSYDYFMSYNGNVTIFFPKSHSNYSAWVSERMKKDSEELDQAKKTLIPNLK